MPHATIRPEHILRAREIVARLSVEEKVAQLEAVPFTHFLDESGRFSEAKAEEIAKYGVGIVKRVYGNGAFLDNAQMAREFNRLQEFLVKRSTARLPAMIEEEAAGGLMAPGATAFPSPLAMASTFDPELMSRVADAIGRQARALGVHQVFSPVLDLCLDPRWGRCEETFGEDPRLAAAMGVSYVKSVQAHGVAATLKHFVAYGMSEGGRNGANSWVGELDLRNLALVPFESAVKEARPLSVMASYNDVDGVPSHANGLLIDGVLRGEWGFEGFVVSDAEGVTRLLWLHRVARDAEEAALLSLSAGIDVENSYAPMRERLFWSLVEAVRSGRLPEYILDRHVERVVAVKVSLGLLENPYVSYDGGPVETAEDRALAREAAERAIILLKNDGVLPLSRDLRVLLTGPGASQPLAMLFDYHLQAHRGLGRQVTPVVTVLEGLRPLLPRLDYWPVSGFASCRDDEIEGAREAARGHDVVVAVVGERSGGFWLRDSEVLSGEGVDRDPTLPDCQLRLLRSLAGSGARLVIVLIAGRPVSLPEDVINAASAVLLTFYPGEEGGNAIARALVGLVNPSGRLPVTIPSSVGDVPVRHGLRRSSASDITVRRPRPLFPFGHGLSYSRVTYSDLRAGLEGGVLRASLKLTNEGPLEAEEVPQLYVSPPSRLYERPSLELIGFGRVRLGVGESKTVSFEVGLEALSVYMPGGRLLVPAGTYELYAGPSSADLRLKAEVELKEDLELRGRGGVLWATAKAL
ncbi:MAG: glycoside hydrolase family 3 C-terminal domain-containing protein [Acidilobus sp.]|nr:glycoside hydrolase family 3 C-terminal domain-containing protein [Acidilobus sp.]